MKRTYPSKVDGVVLLALFAAPVVLILTNVAVPHDQPPALAVGLRIVGTIAMLLVIWTSLSTAYTLDPDYLHVRCGPFTWQIPLRDIHKIIPSRASGSSPALSLDRLRIDYGAGRSLLISPRDRVAFLADLQRRMQALGKS